MNVICNSEYDLKEQCWETKEIQRQREGNEGKAYLKTKVQKYFVPTSEL